MLPRRIIQLECRTKRVAMVSEYQSNVWINFIQSIQISSTILLRILRIYHVFQRPQRRNQNKTIQVERTMPLKSVFVFSHFEVDFLPDNSNWSFRKLCCTFSESLLKGQHGETMFLKQTCFRLGCLGILAPSFRQGDWIPRVSGEAILFALRLHLGGGFKDFVIFTCIWGRFPFWLVFFNGCRCIDHVPAHTEYTLIAMLEEGYTAFFCSCFTPSSSLCPIFVNHSQMLIFREVLWDMLVFLKHMRIKCVCRFQCLLIPKRHVL